MFDLIQITETLCSLDNEQLNLSDKFKSLKLLDSDIEEWWNFLNFEQKLEIGSAALHYNKITANSSWGCAVKDTYAKISNKQRKAIKFITTKKDDSYHAFDVRILFKL